MSKPPVFAQDRHMRYAAERRSFAVGERLVFDDGYRRAHLPLVVPGHPNVIERDTGHGYVAGTYAEPRYGLAIPIPAEALGQGVGFRDLDSEMRAATFGSKIAWSVGALRAHRVHATIMGRIQKGALPKVARTAREVFSGIGQPLTVRLKGPFVGGRNHGRLYFPVYPCLVDGADPFAILQRRLNQTPTGLYLAGYYHLTDSLTEHETTVLAKVMDRWRHRTVADVAVPVLDLHATNDDLALTARTWSTIPVGS